ncbi:MAG: MFS transporter [bacterium]|nr:MFS transporter [bacterium]
MQPRSSGALRAFANRQYTRLWLANFLSYTARWMQMPLLAWMILELTDSPWLVSLVGFFTMAPTLILGLVGGMLVDMADRRRLLIMTQGGSALVSCLLTFLMFTGMVQVWHIYMITLATGVCWALGFPSRRATIFDLLGATGVTNAVAVDTIGMNVSRMLGPGLAGVLIALTGVEGGYSIVTLCYALGYFLLLSLRVEQVQRQAVASKQMMRNLIDGMRYVSHEPTIFAMVCITITMNLLLFPYMPMIPVITRDVLHVGPTLMGALQAVEGFGSMVGASLIASSVNLRYHGRIFVGGSLLALLAMVMFSLSRWYIVSLPIFLVLGFGIAGFATMQTTIVLMFAKDEMRGRALGVVSLAIGSGPFGALMIGAIADSVSPVFAIRIIALMGIVALALIVLILPAIMDRSQPAIVTAPR